jgi:hypothetical protein
LIWMSQGMTGMSQKYVVGIVATSFVAGLLATAIVHGPQELSKADYPYFGFADESAGAATGMLGESKSWWRPIVLPSPDQPVVAGQPAKSWMSWNTLADATRQFFRRHFSQGQSPVVSRPADPPPEQFLAGKTADQPAFVPVWSMPSTPAAHREEQANMVAGLPVPSGGLEPLLPLSALPQQPSPMMLTHQELASLEQLAHRSGPGEVAVTAFRRQAAEMQAEPEAHGQQEVVPDETLPGLKTLSPTPDVTVPTVVEKQVIENGFLASSLTTRTAIGGSQWLVCWRRGGLELFKVCFCSVQESGQPFTIDRPRINCQWH